MGAMRCPPKSLKFFMAILHLMWSEKRSYMDPITLIVTALALGAAAGLKPAAEQAIKDAYSGLKSLIQKYTKVSVEQLEEAPESKARRAVVEEDLTKTGADKDEEVLRQAKTLLDAIQAHAPETASAIGVDLAEIKAASLNIEHIVAQATGVRVRQGEFSADITIRDVRAGNPGETSPNP
jgi:hypothetical protein